jgi:hypothetical protein
MVETTHDKGKKSKTSEKEYQDKIHYFEAPKHSHEGRGIDAQYASQKARN